MEPGPAHVGEGNLLPNLLLFGRLLRGLGLAVDPGRMRDLVVALRHVEPGRRSDFYYTARSLLVRRHEDLPRFDQAFDLFWRAPGERWLGGVPAYSTKHSDRRPRAVPPALRAPDQQPFGFP